MSTIVGPYNHMVFVDGLHWSPLPAWEFPEPTFTPPPVTVATISRWEDELVTGDAHQEDVPEPAALVLLALAVAVVRLGLRQRYTRKTKTT